MALLTYVDRFNVTTGAAGTTIVRTGYGFQPKALIVFCTGRSETTDTVGSGTANSSIGFATSATDRRSHTSRTEDALGTSAAHGAVRVDCIAHTVISGGSTDGLLDISTIGSDGVTFIIDDAFAVDVRVTVWAFGGTDITNAATGGVSAPTTAPNTSSVTVTGSFQPDVVFFFIRGGGSTAAVPNLGVACSASEQGVFATRSGNSQATSNTVRYARADHCIACSATGSTGLVYDGQLSAMTATGFDLSWSTVEASARTAHYLAIKGGEWATFTSATRTDSTPWSVSGLGFTPAGVLIASVGSPTQQTRGASVSHSMLSLGVAASATNRMAQAYSDENGLSLEEEVATAIEHDAVYARLDFADGLAGVMDVQSFDSDGMTFVMTDADPDAAFFWGLAVGSAAAAGDLPVSVSDTLTVGESLLFANIPLSASDAITVGEVVALAVPILPAVAAETVTVGEVATVRFALPLAAAETITTLDVATVRLPVPVSVSDTLTVGDSVTFTGAAPQVSVSDTLTASDVATVRLPVLPVVAADNLTVGDFVTFASAAPLVSVSDTLTVGDFVTFANIPLRAFETVTVGDSRTITLTMAPAEVSQYVLQDRTTAEKWAISIADGELVQTDTTDAAQPEPVLLDTDDGTTHWRLFADNGALGWEETTDPLTPVMLTDTVTGESWELVITGGVLSWRLVVSQYVIQDRVTSEKWAITIADGELVQTASTATAQPEPVLLDTDDGITHWTMFVDDGTLDWEETTDALIPVILTDTVTGELWELVIAEGTLSWRIFTAGPTLPLSAAETVTVGDVATVRFALPLVAAETITTLDVATVRFALPLVAAETVTVGDVATVRLALPVVAAESVTVGDVATVRLALPLVAAETVTVSELATVRRTLPVITAETVTVGDVATVRFALPLVAAETVTVGDVATVRFALPLVAAETVTVSDSVSAQPDILLVSASDTITIIEMFLLPNALGIFAPEVITVSESVSVFPDVLGIFAPEVIAVSESASVFPDALIVDGAETITVSDSVSVFPDVLIVDRAETITVSDSVSVRRDQLIISRAETITVSESVSAQLDKLTISRAETITVSDSITLRSQLLLLNGADIITVGEVITSRVPVLFISRQDTLTIIDESPVMTGTQQRSRKFYVRHVQTVS